MLSMTEEFSEITRRVVSEESGFNKRLKWIREKLGLSLSDVARFTQIPIASLHGWEDCVRTYSYENLIHLILYYNTLWNRKYENGAMFNGYKVDYINLDFVIMGNNQTLDDIRELSRRIEERLQKELINISIELAEKKNQMELFQKAI